jgi:prolyl oligopeptidase
VKSSLRPWCSLLCLFLAVHETSSARAGDALPAGQVARIEELVLREMREQHIPGVSLALVIDGRLAHVQGFGLADVENDVPARPGTVYRLGSISKTITAVAALQLVEQGKLDLDAPVQKYVAGFPRKKWPVTSRHLLGHLSGIRHYRGNEIDSTKFYPRLTDGLKIFQDDLLLFEPGTRFSYTTYGFNLLGCVVERASGMTFPDYIQKHIFNPAGMKTIRVDNVFTIIPHRAQGYTRTVQGELRNSGLADTSYKIPGGGFCSTVIDLARLAIALQDDSLLKGKTRRSMWTSQKTRDGKLTGYGLGWQILPLEKGGTWVGHGGGQQRITTLLLLRPEKKFSLALMTNVEQNVSTRRLAREIIRLLLGPEEAELFRDVLPPVTRRQPVTDTYHGKAVTEDYRWLEDWSNREVRAWSEAQNAFARRQLDRMAPAKLRKRVKEILAARVTSHSRIKYRGGKLFALKKQPPKDQPFLVVLPGIDQPDRARVIVDPGKLDPKGTTAIDWYVPSPDGRLVAVSLSKGGSESGDVHLYETATGRQVHEVIPRVHGGTAGGDLAWTPDGKGFFYTRYPRNDERPPRDRDFYQQLYHHTLGTPTEKDRYELGKDLPRVAEIRLEMDNTSGRLLVSVQDGDSGRFAHSVRSPEGKWKSFSTFGDGIVSATLGPRGSLYVVSRKDAPRGKVLRLSADNPDVSKGTMVIPEGKDTIVTDFYHYVSERTVLPTEDRLYVLYQLGGPSEVRAFDLDGRHLPKPEQLPVGTVRELVLLDDNDLLFANGSYLRPLEQYRYRASTGKTRKTSLATPLPYHFDDIQVVREFATSKDGTQVPVNILVPKGVRRDGRAPCLATGYGGFGSSRTPRMNPVCRLLFDHGFVVAEINLRGGGEFGEDWHRAGMLTRKQNVFDDFSAALRHLVARQYTSPGRLAIQGGSNGGLLVGATLAQSPDLVKAVVSHVGIYDMLRVELSSNGAFNIPEYGTVKDREQFRALYSYSPYHRVKNGVRYPAVLFLTGANDPRVDPMQSRKMTARLQSATASSAPILLRTSAGTGHGLDSSLSERVEEQTHVLAFLFSRLGIKGE